MLVGFLRLNFLRPISEQREWLISKTLKSALVDGHRHAGCLVCLQPARNVIPSQTLAIGYGRSRVALGRSNSFKLQQTPAFKRVNVCELSKSRLCINELKYESLVGPGYRRVWRRAIHFLLVSIRFCGSPSPSWLFPLVRYWLV